MLRGAMGPFVNVPGFGCESGRKFLSERLHIHPRFHAGLVGFLGSDRQCPIVRLPYFILPDRLLTWLRPVSIDGGQYHEHAASTRLDFKACLDWMWAGLVCRGYNSDDGRPKLAG